MPATPLVRDGDTAVERPPADLSELRDRPCWLDLVAPREQDLLHPVRVLPAQGYLYVARVRHGDGSAILTSALAYSRNPGGAR